MPDELKAIVKCANPKCITNNEPMATLFHVIDKDNCVIKCHYCEKEQKEKILQSFSYVLQATSSRPLNDVGRNS